jgi:hypothetical protein
MSLVEAWAYSDNSIHGMAVMRNNSIFLQPHDCLYDLRNKSDC